MKKRVQSIQRLSIAAVIRVTHTKVEINYETVHTAYLMDLSYCAQKIVLRILKLLTPHACRQEMINKERITVLANLASIALVEKWNTCA